MLSINLDGMLYGFLYPLETKLQKGEEAGPSLGPQDSGVILSCRPFSRFSVTWRLCEQVQALSV